MSQIKLTIILDVPDGVTVDSVGTIGVGVTDTPPDQLAPMPDFPAIAAQTFGADLAGCPVHHVPWKTVPAGTSKKTGRAYEAFRACPEMGCDKRP